MRALRILVNSVCKIKPPYVFSHKALAATTRIAWSLISAKSYKRNLKRIMEASCTCSSSRLLRPELRGGMVVDKSDGTLDFRLRHAWRPRLQ
jgi:hypothetical protein